VVISLAELSTELRTLGKSGSQTVSNEGMVFSLNRVCGHGAAGRGGTI
jgi:hypothetical protein